MAATDTSAQQQQPHRFADIQQAPPDAVFAIDAACRADPCPDKINLTVGAYRDGEGKPVVFDAVRLAGERIYATDSKHDKEYLPMGGHNDFVSLARTMIFGEGSHALAEERIASAQSLSGTGALSMIGTFLRKVVPMETKVYISNPTWPNHDCIFQELLGFTVEKYRYWDQNIVGCNIAHMCADLRKAPLKSIVILHACAHNPTGEDPTREEWDQILEVVRSRCHFPILDCAYQGFATSDLERDAYAVRLFERSGLNFAVCQSFAKNMGLYGERVGAAHVVCESKEAAKIVHGRLERICRLMWSNPPRHGAELAVSVLSDPDLNAMWRKQLTEVSYRIADMRTALREALEKRQTPGKWDHITKQIGMFSYTGLTKEQVLYCREKHHIYFLNSGRISMAGVNLHNIDKIADAFNDAVRHA